jgi:hypothetical protein
VFYIFLLSLPYSTGKGWHATVSFGDLRLILRTGEDWSKEKKPKKMLSNGLCVRFCLCTIVKES